MEDAGRALNSAGPKMSELPNAPTPHIETFASASGSTSGVVRGN